MSADPPHRTPVEFADEMHRRGCPFAHGEDGSVTVVGHAEATAIARDPDTFSSSVSAHLQLPNGLDGSEHTAFRRLIDSYLAPAEINRYSTDFRRVARGVVQEALGEARDGDGTVDAVSVLGARFAVRAMMAWLGWPAHLEQRLLDWVRSNTEAAGSGDRERLARVAEDFDGIIAEVAEPRMAAPQDYDDVTARLIADEQLGRRLEFREVVSILRNWTGGDLTSMALCVGVLSHGLANVEGLQAWVRSGVPDTEFEAVLDELLRLDNPFVSNRRVVTRPNTVAGTDFAAGQLLHLHWTGTNRDPRVFSGAFDPAGHAGDNLVWGTGPHRCPGRDLSLLELRTVLRELLDAAIILPVRGSRGRGGGGGVRNVHPGGGWRRRPVRLVARSG